MENLKSAGSWQKLWSFSEPGSLKGHIYTGINHLLLASSGHSSPVWGTFNQVRQNRGSVNRGENEIRMPDIEKFKSSEAYYSALYHEGIHSTGAKKRLDRIKSDHFSNEHAYSREELVAELGSAFLCNIAGIDHNIENTAAYLKSWLTVLENNPSWITWAASRAQKACEYIIPSMASVEKVAA
jgi:antirestriction protein ArdC